MSYGLLADAVLLLHFGFVLFVAAGGLLVMKWPRLAWLHLPALLWAVWIELSGNLCPLTPMEQSLRQQAGEVAYTGSFIGHYIEPILYPAGLTREAQWWLAGTVLALNLLIYLLVIRARRVARSQR